MPYVLWIAAYNTSFLLGYLILDTQFYHIREPDKFPYSRRSSIGRDHSPTRSDRGTLLSPTEAAAAAHSESYSRTPLPPASEPSNSSPQRSNLKRSSSKRVTHSDHSEDRSSNTSNDTPRSSPVPRRAPELLEAINTNGLAVFLLVCTSRLDLSASRLTLHPGSAQPCLVIMNSCRHSPWPLLHSRQTC